MIINKLDFQIMTKPINPTMSRRKLLQVTASGVAISTLGMRPALAEPYDGAFTWISPRGTLEVLDDYGFWIGKKMGYFDGLGVDMQPGPSDSTATVKFVDVGQADMGFPSPGVFSFGLREGMDLKSVFHIGARDTFSLAFRTGEGLTDIKDIEGKTILLGSAAWQPIVDPMLAASIRQAGPIMAADVCSNALIPGANDFDKDAVMADAAAAPVSEAMAAIDIDAIRASMFDQAIGT